MVKEERDGKGGFNASSRTRATAAFGAYRMTNRSTCRPFSPLPRHSEFKLLLSNAKNSKTGDVQLALIKSGVDKVKKFLQTRTLLDVKDFIKTKVVVFKKFYKYEFHKKLSPQRPCRN